MRLKALVNGRISMFRVFDYYTVGLAHIWGLPTVTYDEPVNEILSQNS